MEVDGYGNNRTYDVPKSSCASPITVSKKYGDPGTNTLLMTDTGIHTTGVIAKGQLPHDAYGIQAAYENPAEHGADWHLSKMVKPNRTGQFALKLAIGAGNVHFGVRIIAPEHSPSCTSNPNITFEHVNTGDYFGADGQLAWPNPVNVVANSLHELG
ncbi:MAG: hypothetical protein JWO35_765 [Candidatus Saccharibacteria bacterium]|nr:hypothetical protein [Candidatus Saccharibacteria bacterium]